MLANLGFKYATTICEVCMAVTIMFQLDITDTLSVLLESIIDNARSYTKTRFCSLFLFVINVIIFLRF